MLTIHQNYNVQSVNLQSGSIYTFGYTPFLNDATPCGIVINIITGEHPTSGNRWDLVQMINLHYIPRGDRKRFVNDWKRVMEKSGNNVFCGIVFCGQRICKGK